MGVRRVALGGDILGSRRNPRTITTTITTTAPAPATTRPYITPTTKPTATAAATATATNYWYLQHAKTRRPPTISNGRSKLTSRVGQKGGRDTVHWPTGVHQEGVYTRWNGYALKGTY